MQNYIMLSVVVPFALCLYLINAYRGQLCKGNLKKNSEEKIKEKLMVLNLF